MAAKCPHATESRFRFLYLGNDLKSITALRKALMETECQLVSCSHRESAIKFLESEIPYDLLLIDLEWQGREGLKLAQLARSLPHRKRMPIMLVAAGGLNSQLKTLTGRAGVKKCVTKSPDMDAVIEAIQQMVSTTRTGSPAG